MVGRHEEVLRSIQEELREQRESQRQATERLFQGLENLTAQVVPTPPPPPSVAESRTNPVPAGLDSLISLATRIDNRLRERNRERGIRGLAQSQSFFAEQPSRQALTSPEKSRDPPTLAEACTSEPMQIGRAQLTTEERQRRMISRSCLYCGERGHYIAGCPLKGRAHS
ncbi:hypothetical protein DPEC_G00361200 [Dallia pectoralis]|uniref:Uncharacterized protein n=1 Tax=Dallia pectoralis TaxID=75939 RepID=A0ACC2F0X5_DALPE|nr:hypothetical protein DPEC_G00361200 [Dallia pectoralis]